MNILRTAFRMSFFFAASSALIGQVKPANANPLAACGEDRVQFTVSPANAHTPISAPYTGKAKVYFIEVYDLRDKGRFTKPTIRHGVDGVWIGATKGAMYAVASVDPGMHHLCSRWQSASSNGPNMVSLNQLVAVAGSQYYFRVHISVEVTGYEVGPTVVDLEPLSVDEGQYLLSQLPQSSSTVKP